MTTPVTNITTNAQTALANAMARLAELDAVPVNERVKMTYSDGNQQYGWNEYRASLLNEIAQGEQLLKTAQMVGGPFEVRQTVGCGGWW